MSDQTLTVRDLLTESYKYRIIILVGIITGLVTYGAIYIDSRVTVYSNVISTNISETLVSGDIQNIKKMLESRLEVWKQQEKLVSYDFQKKLIRNGILESVDLESGNLELVIFTSRPVLQNNTIDLEQFLNDSRKHSEYQRSSQINKIFQERDLVRIKFERLKQDIVNQYQLKLDLLDSNQPPKEAYISLLISLNEKIKNDEVKAQLDVLRQIMIKLQILDQEVELLPNRYKLIDFETIDLGTIELSLKDQRQFTSPSFSIRESIKYSVYGAFLFFLFGLILKK